MKRSTTPVHIDEFALRTLADLGFDTDAQAAAFNASPETIRRRRLKWGIPGEGRTMPALGERCRECRGTDDVRLVRLLVSGNRKGVPIWAKATTMCRTCRRKYRRKWKWCRPDEARDVERSLGR